MANHLKMADMQAILALVARGWSYRRIGRELGVDRQTVSNYARQASRDGPNPAIALTGSGGLNEPAPEANPAIALTGSPEPPGGSAAAGEPSGGAEPASNPAMALTGFLEPQSGRLQHSAAWRWREVIQEKLEQGHSVQRIWQDLRSPEHGYGGSYHSVRRLAQKLLAARPLPVRRMECEPGAEAQVDFGTGAPIVGPDGRRKTAWVFRIVLSHSRKGYSEAVLRQSTDDFLRCLENAFAHFGGVPKTLVIDNLRAAVARADWFDPELCPKVRSFAHHYGLAILPTKPYTPRHKDQASCCTS